MAGDAFEPADEPSPVPKWPTHFPDGCPAGGALPTDCPIYRLALDEKDWKSAREKGSYVGTPECVRASLSCFIDLDDLREFRKIKGKFKDHKIVAANLEPKHGKYQIGPTGHYSLWLRTTYLASYGDLFQEIDE